MKKIILSHYPIIAFIFILLSGCDLSINSSNLGGKRMPPVDEAPASGRITKLTDIFDSKLSDADLALHDSKMKEVEAFRAALYEKYGNDKAKREIVDLIVAKLINEYDGTVPERANFFFFAGASGSGKTTLITDIVLLQEQFGFIRAVNNWSETLTSNGVPNLDEMIKILKRLTEPPKAQTLKEYYDWLEESHRANFALDEFSKAFDASIKFDETPEYLELLKKKPPQPSESAAPEAIRLFFAEVDEWEASVEELRLKHASDAGKYEKLKQLLWEILSANGEVSIDIPRTKPTEFAERIQKAAQKVTNDRILLLPLEKKDLNIDSLVDLNFQKKVLDTQIANLANEIRYMAPDDARLAQKTSDLALLKEGLDEVKLKLSYFVTDAIPDPIQFIEQYRTNKFSLQTELATATVFCPQGFVLL